MDDLGGYIGLGLVLGAIVLAVMYWYISIPLALVGLVVHFHLKSKREEEKRLQEERERARLHKERQAAIRDELDALGRAAQQVVTSQPAHVSAAEQHLDQAEVEFEEGAFAPFWDCIERATRALGAFDEGINSVRELAANYAENLPKYQGKPPGFPVAEHEISEMAAVASTSRRLETMVRRAQRDFQFSMIFENRKTNKILIAGFASLGEALDRMTWRISNSLSELTDAVGELTFTVEETASSLENQLASQHEELSGKADTAVEMLDNIQRRRKPTT